MTISRTGFGDLEYLKIILKFIEPELFVCKFSNKDDKFIGKIVEQFAKPDNPAVIITNYYFVGANDSEIAHAEKDFIFMDTLFSQRPVMYLNMQTGMGDPVLRWKDEAGMNPMYRTPEDEDYG